MSASDGDLRHWASLLMVDASGDRQGLISRICQRAAWHLATKQLPSVL